MVRNPYRTPNSSLPLYNSSNSPPQTWISRLMSCLTCGLQAKRSTILRLTVLLFIVTLGLISYYFHLHFTHPTLLSESIPKVQGSYDLSRFKSDVLNPFQTIPNSLRGKKDESHLKTDDKKPTQIEDLAEKDPIAYNPNHFHRYREPLKETKNTEEKTGKKHVPVTTLNHEKKEDGDERLNHTEAIKKIKETSAKLGTIHLHSHNHTSPKLAKIALNLTQSHVHEEKKLEPIRISSHPDSPSASTSKEESKQVALPVIEEQQQPAISSQVESPTKTDSVSLSSLQSENEKLDQNPEPRTDANANSALKQKLMEKLKQMNHPAVETNPTPAIHSSDINKGIHISAKVAAESKIDFKDVSSKEVNTVQQPSTAYDLPHDLVDRLQANNRSFTGGSNQHVGSSGQDGEIVKEKIDYCANNIDPFEKIPVDRFVPPKEAPFESITIWKKKINDFVKSVSKLKIGGEALREKLEEDVTQLKILRFKMFCKYA